MMNVKLVGQLNKLWEPIYPYLAEWIRRRWRPEQSGRIMEIGPFSGGIGSSLLTQDPQLETVCLFQQEDLVKPIRVTFHSKIRMVLGTLDNLPFFSSFDLVIYRGAFFYLTPAIVKESLRILQPGGHALLGGGYGPLTPQEEIEKIADESKDLNYRLGKRLMHKKELLGMVRDAGLEFCSTIIEEGGLWLLVSRDEE
jgi:SAM-dependent methyltransferase